MYDLVTRRFLASCASNAKGEESVVVVDWAEESFEAKGLTVRERGYLEVYPFEKWTGNLLPPFAVGDRLRPHSSSVTEGRTTQPLLLTEADLVGLMDKNGIGTDATIAEHIAKICEREYVLVQKVGKVSYLVPSTLGIGLVRGYEEIAFERSLCKPHLRRLVRLFHPFSSP